MNLSGLPRPEIPIDIATLPDWVSNPVDTVAPTIVQKVDVVPTVWFSATPSHTIPWLKFASNAVPGNFAQVSLPYQKLLCRMWCVFALKNCNLTCSIGIFVRVRIDAVAFCLWAIVCFVCGRLFQRLLYESIRRALAQSLQFPFGTAKSTNVHLWFLPTATSIIVCLRPPL